MRNEWMKEFTPLIWKLIYKCRVNSVWPYKSCFDELFSHKSYSKNKWNKSFCVHFFLIIKIIQFVWFQLILFLVLSFVINNVKKKYKN